jgi:hypothetical protein
MKIFGIGLNKTGTTTLGTCLKQLGFRHTSWSLPLLEQVAVGEFEGLLQTVASHDSFEDWPYPLVFEVLDHHFPGSRFILTRRSSPERWLCSFKAHALRTDPQLGARTRSLAYGLPYPQLDPEAHLRRYAQHLQRVRSYFAQRPTDLLEVCWEEEASWGPLCTFLQRPASDLPFPHANARQPAQPQREKQNLAQLAWYRKLQPETSTGPRS